MIVDFAEGIEIFEVLCLNVTSSASQNCPQPSSLIALMKLAVCTRSSLEPELFFKRGSLELILCLCFFV